MLLEYLRAHAAADQVLHSSRLILVRNSNWLSLS